METQTNAGTHMSASSSMSTRISYYPISYHTIPYHTILYHVAGSGPRVQVAVVGGAPQGYQMASTSFIYIYIYIFTQFAEKRKRKLFEALYSLFILYVYMSNNC